MKILLLDIETAPNTAYVWGLFRENIPLARLVETGYVLCWAAKWLNEDTTYTMDLGRCTTHRMLKEIHKLLNEADAVVHYNGTRFDIPTLNKEFLLNGFKPPAPYKQIDLLRTARNQFKFTSNKLDHVAEQLGLGNKVRHRGFELWIDCMNNVPEAWNEMVEYNIGDVTLLEKLYEKLLPWIRNHSNFSLHSDNSFVCPNCGKSHYTKRGFYYTHNCKYQRYRCSSCGTWFRATKNVGRPAGEKFVFAG